MKKQLDIETEFVAILNRNGKLLGKVCEMFFSTQDYEFQELRQEIMLALWKEYSRYGFARFGNANERTWIFTIAWRAAMVYCRNWRRRGQKEMAYMHPPEQKKPMEQEDQTEVLRQVTLRLSAEDKRWLAYYLDQCPYKIICELEKISNVTARKRMSRMIMRLRKFGKYYE